jgi:hypothetical protein
MRSRIGKAFLNYIALFEPTAVKIECAFDLMPVHHLDEWDIPLQPVVKAQSKRFVFSFGKKDLVKSHMHILASFLY